MPLNNSSNFRTAVIVAQDGTGDYNGTSAALIQDAIDFVNAKGGGRVLVKAGTYTTVGENYIQIAPNIILEGEGFETIIKRNGSAADERLLKSGTDDENFQIKNLLLDNSETSLGGAGYQDCLQLVVNTDFIVENVKIINTGHDSIHITDCQDFILKDLICESYSQAENYDGIRISQCDRFTCSNLLLKSGDDGVVLSDCHNATLNGIVRNGAYIGGAFKISGVTTSPCSNIVVSNIAEYNTSNTGTAVVLHGETVTSAHTNVVISNITAEGCNRGISINKSTGTAYAFNNMTISNLNCSGCNTGIYINDETCIEKSIFENFNIRACATGLYLQTGKDLHFVNGIIDSCTTTGINLDAGDTLLLNVVFDNVKILNTTGRGISNDRSSTTGNTCYFNKCKIDGGSADGVLSRGAKLVFTDCEVTNNGDYGFDENSTNQLEIYNTIIEGNSTGTLRSPALKFSENRGYDKKIWTIEAGSDYLSGSAAYNVFNFSTAKAYTVPDGIDFQRKVYTNINTGKLTLNITNFNNGSSLVLNQYETAEIMFYNSTWNYVGGWNAFANLSNLDTSYGQIYTTGGSTAQTITTAATYEKVTGFATDGISAGLTASAANDRITLPSNGAGTYKISLAICFSGTVSSELKFKVYKNGSADVAGLTMTRKLGTGGDVGSASISGLATLADSDYIEIYATTDGDGDSFIIVDATLNARKVAN